MELLLLSGRVGWFRRGWRVVGTYGWEHYFDLFGRRWIAGAGGAEDQDSPDG
jgi:hypothetical protein